MLATTLLLAMDQCRPGFGPGPAWPFLSLLLAGIAAIVTGTKLGWKPASNRMRTGLIAISLGALLLLAAAGALFYAVMGCYPDPKPPDVVTCDHLAELAKELDPPARLDPEACRSAWRENLRTVDEDQFRRRQRCVLELESADLHHAQPCKSEGFEPSHDAPGLLPAPH
jgi:hypothetical protein